MELTKIPYEILLGPKDHTFHYIYEPNQSEVLTHFSDPELRHYADRANEIYSTDDIEIDDDPIYSPNDTGCWVGAWVFVPNEERDV